MSKQNGCNNRSKENEPLSLSLSLSRSLSLSSLMFKLHLPQTYKVFQSVYPYLLPRCSVIRLGVPLSSFERTLSYLEEIGESEFQQNKSEEEKER